MVIERISSFVGFQCQNTSFKRTYTNFKLKVRLIPKALSSLREVATFTLIKCKLAAAATEQGSSLI